LFFESFKYSPIVVVIAACATSVARADITHEYQCVEFRSIALDVGSNGISIVADGPKQLELSFMVLIEYIGGNGVQWKRQLVLNLIQVPVKQQNILCLLKTQHNASSEIQSGVLEHKMMKARD
jgi:hypothetical protein